MFGFPHRCCECSTSLSHWYYEKDGRLFCKKDYWAKFGELCHGCTEPITTGLIMVSVDLETGLSLSLCLLESLPFIMSVLTQQFSAVSFSVSLFLSLSPSLSFSRSQDTSLPFHITALVTLTDNVVFIQLLLPFHMRRKDFHELNSTSLLSCW